MVKPVMFATGISIIDWLIVAVILRLILFFDYYEDIILYLPIIFIAVVDYVILRLNIKSAEVFKGIFYVITTFILNFIYSYFISNAMYLHRGFMQFLYADKEQNSIYNLSLYWIHINPAIVLLLIFVVISGIWVHRKKILTHIKNIDNRIKTKFSAKTRA
jgi:hypothetical protein